VGSSYPYHPIVVFALCLSSIRSSVPSLLRLLIRPPMSIALGGLILWVCLEVLCASWLSVWNASMVTSTSFWFVGNGLVLFIAAVDAGEDRTSFARRRAAQRISLSPPEYSSVFPRSRWPWRSRRAPDGRSCSRHSQSWRSGPVLAPICPGVSEAKSTVERAQGHHSISTELSSHGIQTSLFHSATLTLSSL
jgi:hypothetical protein